jgi:4'-phosphopantetheinyl transferase
MIRWLIQSVADHPDLKVGRPPPGVLTEAELRHFYGYTNPRRRRDWLLGRWTAKQLVRRSLSHSAGFPPALQSFTIAQHSSGVPYIACSASAPAGCDLPVHPPLSLSISHSYDYALCAVAQGRTEPPRLGVDLEVVQRRTSHLVLTQGALTADEARGLGHAPVMLQTLMVVATWSAKQAVMKLAQLGASAEPQQVQCLLRPGRPRVWQAFLVEWNGTSIAELPGSNRSVSGWWRVFECGLRPGRQYVATLAVQGTRL